MILEQLQIIKKFGCPRESDVSMADIRQKEQELGVSLPTALKEFYLTFHRDDPIFSSVQYILPLDELRIVEKKEQDKIYRFLLLIDGAKDRIFSSDRDVGIGIDEKMEEDLPVAQCFIQSDDFSWFHNTKFSPWFLNEVAYQQLHVNPNIIIAKGETLGKAFSNPTEQEVYSVIHEYHCETYLVLNHYNLFAMQKGMDGAYIVIPEEKVGQIEQFMQELGLTYTWDKRNGVRVPRSNTRPQVKKRPLRSIQPVIDLVLEFLHLPKGGLTEDVVTAAEQRLGFSFPLPLREAYLQVPQELLQHPDHLFSPERLAWDEEKKLFFFAGDQGEPEYAIEDGSPIVLVKNQISKQWIERALLDNFLASEMIWNAMNQEDRGTVLTELLECTKRMLGPKGKLGKYLVSVLPNVTKGSRRQLYTTPAHDILLLRDEDMQSTYLASVGEEPLERLEKEAEIELSWL